MQWMMHEHVHGTLLSNLEILELEQLLISLSSPQNPFNTPISIQMVYLSLVTFLEVS